MAQRFGSFTTGHVVTAAELNTGAAVYTSGTRPTGTDVYEGLHIWETDTNRWLMYDGTNWIIMAEPAQSYTPTLTNLASATLATYYRRSDGWCDYYGSLTIAGGVVPTGVIGISLPVNHAATLGVYAPFPLTIADAGTAVFEAVGTPVTSRFDVSAVNVAGTYPSLVATSATSPMTWANSDALYWSFRYPMANRYT